MHNISYFHVKNTSYTSPLSAYKEVSQLNLSHTQAQSNYHFESLFHLPIDEEGADRTKIMIKTRST